MATQNLSEYDMQDFPEKEVLGRQKYAVAVSDWNPKITSALLKGALDALAECGVKPPNIKVVHVPGTFELTYASKQLSRDPSYNAVIALGCVIQGETPHFKYVCEGVAAGISQLNTESAVPVIFGVLTTANMQQALDRSGGIHGNKGIEAAITAVKMANIIW